MKAESGPAGCAMKPRKLAARAIPTTVPIRSKRVRIGYVFLGAASRDTGGREFPLGRPILHT